MTWMWVFLTSGVVSTRGKGRVIVAHSNKVLGVPSTRHLIFILFRSHRFMAIAAGFLAWLGYQTIFRARIGYVFLPFLIAFSASVIGCAGCCCLIPTDPDDKSDKD